jgi:hypothetical protein
MAKRKYDWMWRRLAEQGESQRQQRRPRRIELRGDPTKRTVRDHVPHPITPAIERFIAMTERRVVGDDTCVIWKGGETFRVDDEAITTPARFYWETMLGEKLGADERLRQTCKTPRCIKHRIKQ